MVDVVDSTTRSRMMSAIRGKNTTPEMVVRKGLHALGFRFRLHVSSLPGKPDIVLPRYHAVILVHGCFWHGHDCPLFRLPATRVDFWREKIDRNRSNDRKVQENLLGMGWRVGTVWECALRGKGRHAGEVVQHLSEWLHGNGQTLELKG